MPAERRLSVVDRRRATDSREIGESPFICATGERGIPGGAGATACSPGPTPPPPMPFDVVEADIESMQRAMSGGTLSARRLSETYLARVAARNPTLHAIIETNPDALLIADQLDAERQAGHVRGALHGIPILVKDTIETRDRMETAGRVAGDGRHSSGCRRLRRRTAARRGCNCFWKGKPDRVGRCGCATRVEQPRRTDGQSLRHQSVAARCSSAGSASAVAANLAAASLGGETVGSIAGPASVMGVVGLKTTAGLVSRRGTVPAAQAIDSIGPIARTVRDAAIVLNAIAAADGGDPQSVAGLRPPATDYAARLGPNGLRGVHLGVVREASLGAEAAPLFDKALDDLRALGAVLVDVEPPAEFFGQYVRAQVRRLVLRRTQRLTRCLLFLETPQSDDSKRRRHPGREPAADESRSTARTNGAAGSRNGCGGRSSSGQRAAQSHRDPYDNTKGLEPMLAKYAVEGFVSSVGPTVAVNGPPPELPNMIAVASLSGGAPLISVPMGQVNQLPIGLLFISKRWSDASLLQWAYAYEQRTHHRAPPPELPHDASK